ncbi:hypothetical protein Acr_00g0055890 [Actinidia rufa]|uniref:Uncharacterized protein n=1 Tax=Actinidia rufa TaxID=165716 RepID=A0A7J0DM25_9ERIC|nr:hypothetical protein Acr_00g0055890 [Actinidia rufa]
MFVHLRRLPKPLPRSSTEVTSNSDYWLLTPKFLPQQFRAVCGNDNSQLFMHLRSRLLPRPSASSPLDNRAHPMANTSQAPDLEGLHHEMYGIAEKLGL